MTAAITARVEPEAKTEPVAEAVAVAAGRAWRCHIKLCYNLLKTKYVRAG